MAKTIKLVSFKKRVATRQIETEEIKKHAKHDAVEENISFIKRTHLTPAFKTISESPNSMVATIAHAALTTLTGSSVDTSYRVITRPTLEKAMSDLALTMACDHMPEGMARHDAKDYMDMLIQARDTIDWENDVLAVTTS